MGPPNLVIVTGMHRSGTSVAARAVQGCGYAMGSNLMPGSRDNPKGFFEDLELVAINDAIMDLAGWKWNTATGPFPAHLLTDQILDRMRRFLRTVRSWGDYAALKDPRFCITYPAWAELLTGTSVFVIGAIRNPQETIQSVMLRDGMGFDAAKNLWLLYNIGLLRMWKFWPGTLCSYERFLTAPKSALRDLATFIHLSNPSIDTMNAFEDFMTPTLHRHSQPMSLNGFSTDEKRIYFDVIEKLMKHTNV